MYKVGLTGGLSVGKTSILKLLNQENFQVIDEISNLLINQTSIDYGSPSFMSDPVKCEQFQLQVVEEQLRQEIFYEHESGLLFLDRTIIDEILFFVIENRSVPDYLHKLAENHRYDKIFLIESLPSEFYVSAQHRPQSIPFSNKIEKLINKVYCYFGYNLVSVPALSPKNRMNFILKNL